MATNTDSNSMFSAYGSIFDAATADNVGVRDRALSVAQLQPGRATVYGAHQAGGMLMQNLAGMAGMKTAEQQKAETINRIMKDSQNLDPNDPQSATLLGQKFINAGLYGIGQKFIERGRTMSVEDTELGQKDTELDLKKDADATLKAYYEKIGGTQADRLKYEEDKETTRITELAASLGVDKAALDRSIAKGELVKIPVKGNTTGALTWARHICDSEGKNCTTTPLTVDGYQPSDATTDATTKDSDINTVEGLSNTGLMIADFGTGTDVRAQQLIGAEDREIIASSIESNYSGDTDTIEGIKELRKLIKNAISGSDSGVWEGSLTDTPTYSRLESSLISLKASESATTRATRLQNAANKVELSRKQDDDYKQVIQGNDGKDIAGGYILKTGGHTEGDTEAGLLAGQIGADINAYDMALSGNRQLDGDGFAQGVTPQQAYLGGYYEKALEFPGVYEADKPGWGGTEYDSLKFKEVLNKTFARGTSTIYLTELESFVRAGLVIPNVTKIEGKSTEKNPTGVGTLTLEALNELISAYNNNTQ